MTTNSDGALPNPGDQQNPDPATEAAAAAAAAASAQVQGQDDAEDIDAIALREAQAAADAEDAAGGATVEGAAAKPGDTTPASQQQPTQQQQDQKSPTGQAADAVMIPKARFDEVAAQRDKATQGEAYWRGRAEAAAPQQQPDNKSGQQGQQQQQPTADQRLADIQSQQDALATKYDNGEITMAELTRQQRALTNKEQDVREEILLTKVKPATDAAPTSGNDELYLSTLTAQLEKEHPWVQVFDQVGTDIDWNFLRQTATQNLLDRGVDPTKGNLGRYELRKEVASLADQYGPGMVASKARAKGIAIPGQIPAASQQQQDNGNTPPGPKKSPIAAARAAKLETLENQPPNLSAMSGSAVNPGALTDAQLENMSEDAYDALPEAARNKLLGVD